jgi:succinate-semialdehyde dehydrogenase/glutarate-semialdehyde dehydrogenase
MTGYPELELYIDGRWKRADGQAVLNPADETVLGTVPSATIADLDDAIAAAERGFKVWRKTSPAKRTQIILKAASLIRERANEMAVAMTLEQGKPIEQARLEILRGCDIIEWDATEGLRMYGRVIPSEEGMRHTVLRQPIGPVAAFSPWNFPMSSPGRKVAGALSSGCSIILKASEETPAGAVQLVRAFHDAGLPPGVLNLVFGNPAEISGHLIPQASIRLITLHGLDPGRKVARRNGGPLHEAGDHGARRACARDRLRRRRSCRDRGHVGAGKIAQRRPGLRGSDAVLRPGVHLQALCGHLCGEGRAAQGRKRARSFDTAWSARQFAPDRRHGEFRG